MAYRRRALIACLAILLLAFLPAAARQQARLGGHAKTDKLASITVSGLKRFSREQTAAIIAMLGLHVGDTITRDDLQSAADRLAQLGPFSNVRFRFTSFGENLSVEFQVEEAPAMPVSFDNFPWFTDAELGEALQKAVGFFDGTAPEQGSILEQMSEALQQILASRGVRAAVEHSLIAEPAGDRTVQQFSVVGASLKIEGVQFSDSLPQDSQRLQLRLPDLVGKPYSRYAVEVFAVEHVRPLYLERGHLRVTFGPPAARFTGPPNKPLADSVVVLLPIAPGPVYHWAGVRWQGNAALGAAGLDEFVSLKPDELADGMKIAALWSRVEKEYGRRGYLDVKLRPEAVFDEAARRVSYRVAITEGPVYRMGEMVITGLSLAAERKLREAWRISKDQVFDRAYFEDFLAAGIKQAFGELPVHYDEMGRWLRTHPETGAVDVLLDFH